ncbi:MAG: PAS domain S-box protein, partial [Victivallales bacterium]|nr:PAS domain S-box protein [Victivallales bacterium]
EGVVTSGFVVFLDVTARRETELALAASEERLSLATQSAGLGIWHLDLADNRLTWDNRMHQLYGTNPEAFQGIYENWRRAVHPDDLAKAEAGMRESLEGQGIFHSTFRTVHPDGKVRYIDAYASVQRDQHGTPLAMTGVNWDSTDRVLAEQKLRDSREEFRRLFTTMLAGFALHEIILDDTGRPCDYRFLEINPAFERITGISRARAIGHTLLELLPETEMEWIERFGKVAIEGKPIHFEQFSRQLGKHFQVTAYCPREGQFACVFRDVTKRIQDTQALRESEERFREIIQNLASGVAFLSPIDDGEDFVIRSLNPAAAHFDGHDQQPHVGKPVRTSLPQFADTGLFETLTRVWRSGVAERLPVVTRRGAKVNFWIEAFVCRLGLGEVAAVFEDRTEQHRYQEEIEAREQQLQSIFAAAPVGIGLLRDRQFVTVNDQFCQMIGREREEFIGQSARMLYASNEEYERVGRDKYGQIRKHGTGSVETRFLPKEGAMIDVILSSTPLDRDDWSKGVTFTALDITKRKRTERQIQLETEVLESLNSPAPQREIVRKIAAAIRRRAGLQAVGIRLRDGDDFPYYHVDGFPEGFNAQGSHLVQRDEDGQPLLDDQGQVRMACLCGDVIRGRFDPALPFFTQAGSFWANCMTKLDAELVATGSQLPAAQLGNTIYESLVLIPLRSEGKTIGLLQLSDERPNLFTPDVIEFYEGLGASIGVSVARERDEEALRRNEERLHEILDAVGAGVIAVDSETQRVTYANPAAASLLRTSREALLGLAGQAVSPPSIGDDGPASDEVDLTTRDGQLVPVLRTVSRAELNGRDCLLESFINLTGQRRAEEEQQVLESRLRQSQRLEAIGTLAGGIAHDFNNILYAVLGFAELALDDCPPGSDASDNIEEVIRAGNRAKEIVNQILTFSRQTEQEKLPLHLQGVVGEVGKLIRSSMPSSIAIETDVDPDCPPVLADPSQMHQVAMNLCTNAYQAMWETAQAPGQAERDCLIRLELRQRDLTAADARQMPGLRPGPHVEFAVHDTGPGIPPEALEHIFEPYFTTKTKERGTGLGLAIVQGIVSSHDGAITIESRVGDGTSFRVLLPASEEAETPFTPQPTPAPMQSTQERILFVDDEAPLRQLAEIGLGNLGYVVTTASDGKKALEILHQDSAGFDLLITDLTMPGMSGIELAREALQIYPDLPILLCTGHGEAVTRQQAISAGIRELMIKPILPSGLARWVQETLHPLAPN